LYSLRQQTSTESDRKPKKAKVLPEPRAYRAALISVSIALSQTPAEAASPRTRGQCVRVMTV